MGKIASMEAMVLERVGQPLVRRQAPVPVAGKGQVLIRVKACGVCRTDLHVVDGELPQPKLPLIPGHEVVGTVVRTGAGVKTLREGDAVGVPWLGFACGECPYCRGGQENLCDNALYTGYTMDGGYAEYMVAFESFCLPLPAGYMDAGAAPLLCAGLIGYRSYRMAGLEGEGKKHLGIYGFGAAAHLLIQVARYEGKHVYAFTREGDHDAQSFAISLGADWAGDSGMTSPEPMDAAIIFAPVGPLVPAALASVRKGGCVVCGGIHMSDIPAFPYKLLWEERVVRSVANLTRKDGVDFLELAPRIPVRTETQPYPLARANEALTALREGKVRGAAVLVIGR